MSEDEESQVCAKCHEHYSMDAQDMEPTKFCDDCAHEVAEEVAEALRPFVSEFKRWIANSGRNSAYRKQWNERMPDHFPIQIRVTMGDCRAAERALGLLKDK